MRWEERLGEAGRAGGSRDWLTGRVGAGAGSGRAAFKTNPARAGPALFSEPTVRPTTSLPTTRPTQTALISTGYINPIKVAVRH